MPRAFPSFVPDEGLHAPRDLGAFGVPGVVRPLGGHTRGSAIVEVPGRDVIVGDLVRGGRLGGRWRGAMPMTHYYEEDPRAVTSVADAVVAGGARRLLVGHGGPLDAAAVAAWLERRTT